ncbi:MAG: class IV adenylate cyclase [Planctomycetota bacterium]|nr:class IV adenylate cyclase [Planctomycetota bacterium]
MKFQVDSLEPVRKVLRNLAAEYLGTVRQIDIYFDTPDGALRRSDCGLRLRRSRRLAGPALPPAGGALLTYKGPRRPHAGCKVREELQTRCDDAEAARRILRACGLVETLLIEKRRATYSLAGCLIALDTLPGLGQFIEIEATDEKKIHSVRRKLSLTGEPITATYAELLAARRKKK